MKTMKTILVTVTILLIGFSKSMAQTKVGAGFLINNGLNAIEAKANFNITDQIDLSPSVDYFLNTPGYSAFMISADGHYNFEASDTFQVYPLVGLNYFIVSGNGYTGTSDIGFTLGGGANYAISNKMSLFGEVKYIRSSLGLSVGILFSL